MKTKQQPNKQLAKTLNIPDVYMKREDEHKYGSHKGRAIPQMIKDHVREGAKNFVISSSGNAALAAIMYTEAHNQNNPDKQITLRVLVGQHIDLRKLDALRKEIISDAISLEQVERPKQMAFQIDKSGEAVSLRQSTDDRALLGYQELAFELAKIPNLQAVFVGTSSGTTAQGLAMGFAEKNLAVQIHVAQTTGCHPIAEVFETPPSDEPSIAGAIVDKVAHRKQAVVDAIQASGGHGWIVTNDEIHQAQLLIKQTAQFDTSPNGALGAAALQKATQNGWTWSGPVAVIICGQ